MFFLRIAGVLVVGLSLCQAHLALHHELEVRTEENLLRFTTHGSEIPEDPMDWIASAIEFQDGIQAVWRLTPDPEHIDPNAVQFTAPIPEANGLAVRLQPGLSKRLLATIRKPRSFPVTRDRAPGDWLVLIPPSPPFPIAHLILALVSLTLVVRLSQKLS